MKFFCYGTLKKGFSSHRLLSAHNSTFLGKFKTSPDYHIYNLGWFPGMVFDDQTEGGVTGEVYEIDEDCLAELDIYEGHPSLFRRQEIELENGEIVIAYLYNNPIQFNSRVESGCWEKKNGKLLNEK
jgi:gamma-glutamylcyclotransferase (GGCT)/AIG2-like uncharacterized protein YtfP